MMVPEGLRVPILGRRTTAVASVIVLAEGGAVDGGAAGGLGGGEGCGVEMLGVGMCAALPAASSSLCGAERPTEHGA
ncbi:hypothetical protein V497_01864 [Pseudogymnoascus sp. VKM F-4516 (FW-969)]|nr:hypothetical protein V497_01864 [Pseudogymnoascus sp. VKM F-4516 (FW-969)]